MSGVVTLGETMGLFRALSVGSLAQVSDVKLGIGGAESNVAIGVVRLGGRATWIGRVGDDSIGRRVVRELRAEGVETLAVVDPDASTGLMLKEHPTGQTTRVVYYRRGSAGSRLNHLDVDFDVVRAADIVHVTGITLAISADARAAAVEAVGAATKAGVPVSFDVNHRASLWRSDAVPIYRAVAERATVVFAGVEEAAMLSTGTSPRELAKGIAALGPTEVIIKLGAEGCLALIDGELHVLPAVEITPVDTVGAGDAFVAGYLAERLAGGSPLERLQTALRAGAFACLGPGDWESYPARRELGLLDRSDPVIR